MKMWIERYKRPVSLKETQNGQRLAMEGEGATYDCGHLCGPISFWFSHLECLLLPPWAMQSTASSLRLRHKPSQSPLPASFSTSARAKKSRVFTGTWDISATWVNRCQVRGVNSWTKTAAWDLGVTPWYNYGKVLKISFQNFWNFISL